MCHKESAVTLASITRRPAAVKKKERKGNGGGGHIDVPVLFEEETLRKNLCFAAAAARRLRLRVK